MPNIVILKDADEIESRFDAWTQVEGSGSLINNQGNKVSFAYKGHIYRVIERLEHSFSFFERIGRVALGVLMSVCTFGIAYRYSEVIRNLCTKSKKTICFASLVKADNDGTLDNYHNIKKVKKKGKAVKLDFNILDFSEYPNHEEKLRETAKKIVQAINTLIKQQAQASKNSQKSIAEVRTIRFYPTRYNECAGALVSITGERLDGSEETEKTSYTAHLLRALENVGAIYSAEYTRGLYTIRA